MKQLSVILMALAWGLFPCPADAVDLKDQPTVTSAVEVVSVQDSFTIEPLASNVFAAIAKPTGKASTNAMFVLGRDSVVAVGAHMTKEVTEDLYAAIRARTGKPVKYFVLTHHHSGYTNIDFDFPPGQDLLMSWQTWRNLDMEVRDSDSSLVFFNEGLTLKLGGITMILTNVGKGHTDGDVVVYLPETDVVFASDLFYVNSVGFMGSGYMTEWLLALDFLEQLGAGQIVPGYGPVSTAEGVFEYSQFFRDFLTAVLQRIERGDSLDQVLADFDLPEYHHLDGYDQLIKLNLVRAYQDLKTNFGGM